MSEIDCAVCGKNAETMMGASLLCLDHEKELKYFLANECEIHVCEDNFDEVVEDWVEEKKDDIFGSFP